MSKPDLNHVAADMHARARALREEASQLDANADALDKLLAPPAPPLPPRWFDYSGVTLLEAAAALAGVLTGEEPEVQCNIDDFVDAGLRGMACRMMLARGSGMLIPTTSVPRGRVIAK